jgi:hypothetical protein
VLPRAATPGPISVDNQYENEQEKGGKFEPVWLTAPRVESLRDFLLFCVENIPQ